LRDSEIDRAAMLMGIAAKYINSFCNDSEIFYDEAWCDGYCLAEDLRIQAEILNNTE
jgi:hypothetical protein